MLVLFLTREKLNKEEQCAPLNMNESGGESNGVVLLAELIWNPRCELLKTGNIQWNIIYSENIQ